MQLLAEIRDLLAPDGRGTTRGGAISSHHRPDERRIDEALRPAGRR